MRSWNDVVREHSSTMLELQLRLMREIKTGNPPIIHRLKPALWPFLLQMLDNKKTTSMLYSFLRQNIDTIASETGTGSGKKKRDIGSVESSIDIETATSSKRQRS